MQYDQLEFSTELEQSVEEAKSTVNFHALVEDKTVAIVEVESPKAMHRLGELQMQNAFEVRWTNGSGNLASRIFSKVGLGFLIREQSLTMHSRLRSISVYGRRNGFS